MTDQTAIDLLRRTESLLSALHGSVGRHDNLAANLGCAGCELRDAVSRALSTLAVPSAAAPPTQAALRNRIAAAIYEHMHPGSYWSDTSMPADWRPEYLEEADAVLAVLFGPIPTGTDVATWTAIRAIQLMNEAGRQRDAAMSAPMDRANVLAEVATALKGRHCSPESVNVVHRLIDERLCTDCQGYGQTSTETPTGGTVRRCRACNGQGLRRLAEAPQPETEARPFVPPTHYRGRDGTAYCVHATPVGPDSCRECWELDAAAPAVVAQPGTEG